MFKAESLVIAGAFACGSLFAFAQGAVSGQRVPLKFEVASVRPNNAGGTVAIRGFPAGRWMASNASLKLLITWAYDITDERLVGGPNWLDSARFDITAQTPDENPTLAELHAMVQSLLVERFQLRVHSERRDLQMYVMELDSGGPKVQALNAGTTVSQDPFKMTVLGRLSGTHVTAAMLAKALSNQLGRYVEDRTGFDSVFDFTLIWKPEGALAVDMPPDDDRPSIFTAIRDQLGFKLIPAKGPVEVIAIDHVERFPSAN